LVIDQARGLLSSFAGTLINLLGINSFDCTSDDLLTQYSLFLRGLKITKILGLL